MHIVALEKRKRKKKKKKKKEEKKGKISDHTWSTL
jgi:hypothetical protein